MEKTLNPLCEKLGYTFKDITLLKKALSHRSAILGSHTASNERLEFLGDSIVNFVIASALYTQHPNAKEGQLSRLRSSLVKGETLATVAQEIALGEFLVLGAGEVKSGGGARTSILADAMEAVIGAIYLDGGFEACEKCILKWYEARLTSETLFDNLKDPKTQLQEFVQSKKLQLPIYKVAKIEGKSHLQTFHVECSVEGVEGLSKGVGTNRRKAEQEAAENFMQQFFPEEKPVTNEQ